MEYNQPFASTLKSQKRRDGQLYKCINSLERGGGGRRVRERTEMLGRREEEWGKNRRNGGRLNEGGKKRGNVGSKRHDLWFWIKTLRACYKTRLARGFSLLACLGVPSSRGGGRRDGGIVGWWVSLFSPLLFFFLNPFVKVRYYSCCWLYRREIGRPGLKKWDEGMNGLFMCTKRGRREERGREIRGGGREWGWVNSEVRSSSLLRRLRRRLPGFLMSTAAGRQRENVFRSSWQRKQGCELLGKLTVAPNVYHSTAGNSPQQTLYLFLFE